LDVPVRNLWLTTSLDSAEYVKNNKGADYNAEIEKLLGAVENTVSELKDIADRLFKGSNSVKAYELISDYRTKILDDIKQAMSIVLIMMHTMNIKPYTMLMTTLFTTLRTSLIQSLILV
jgi:signal transduction protein with GAF and PtsI domain